MNQQSAQPQKVMSSTHYDSSYRLSTQSPLLAGMAVAGQTTALTLLGTSVMVALHHRYRRQANPDARLLDYLQGAQNRLARLQQGYRAGTKAFIEAYHTPIDTTAPANAAVERQSSPAGDSEQHAVTMPDSSLDSMASRAVRWVSGVAALADGGFGVTGIDEACQIVWQTPMPERVHDIVVQPQPDAATALREVVVMGRRPSERFWVLDAATGNIRHAISAQADRHFYGHACYSLDGHHLYVSENDTINLVGKIGVYDSRQGYQKVLEFDSFGIGPHELVMHPDGETLVIANGGIKTEKASREELNLETMKPSLVYLNRHDGRLLEQILPEHNQMSVRHLDIHRDGRVMIGIQFQGARHINVPLVLTHQRGDAEFKPLQMPDNQWHCFHQYIASVAVDSEHNLLCVTSPIGGCAVVYDLDNYQLVDQVSLPDCAGAAVIQASPMPTTLAASQRQQATVTTDKSKSHYQSAAEQVNATSANQLPIGFIVSDGQGSLTTLKLQSQRATMQPACGTDTNDLKAKVLNKRWQMDIDPRYHKMSFDNHLQAL